MDTIEEMRAALPPYVDIKRVHKWADALTAERDRLAAENATLEAMLADEVAENVRLRSREVGDEVGNLLQEVTDLKNELARIQAGPHFVQYVDRLNEIYRRRREGGDDAERFLAIDELCRKLANESDEFMAQRDEARAELARVKAESLRVVVDGDACKFDDVDTKFISHRGHIYGWHEIVYHEKSTTPIYGGDTLNVRLSNGDTIVQPVRLERWEATDDHY